MDPLNYYSYNQSTQQCAPKHNLPERRYDRIQGLMDMAPYTKGVSAKSYDFDKFGQETKINYKRCLDILLTDSFDGNVSAEYEGHHLSEFAGSEATVKLLKKLQYS